MDLQYRRRLGKRFLEERAFLEQLLAGNSEALASLGEAARVVSQRSSRVASVLAELQRRERSGTITRPLAIIAASVIHMSVNRLMRFAQREHELVCYEFLDRLHRAQRARVDAAA